MSGHQIAVEARHGMQPPEHGQHAAQGRTPAQARRQYLQGAGGGLVAACIASVTRPAEIRTRDGTPFLVFGTVAEGVRSADEAAASIRVEYFGDDAEALATRLTKNTQIYAEGSLRLSTWTGRDGVERSGLHIKATHVEVLGAHA